MLNLLFQPPEHLCSERRAVHSQAEPSLLGIICYKTQFSFIPEGIFFLYKVQARILEGKHLSGGGKRVGVFFLAVWIVSYLSKNIIHGKYDFADFSLEKIKLSLPFSEGTSSSSRRSWKRKNVFSYQVRAHTWLTFFSKWKALHQCARLPAWFPSAWPEQQHIRKHFSRSTLGDLDIHTDTILIPFNCLENNRVICI